MNFIKHRKLWSAIVTIVLIVSMLALIWQLYILDILPANLQVPVIIILILITIIFVLLLWGFEHSRTLFLVLLIINLVFAAVFGSISYYLFRTNNTLSLITAIKNINENKISVVVMDDSSIHSLEDLSGKKVGLLKNIDRSGTDKTLDKIEKESSVHFDTVELDSVPQEAMELYSGEVDAVILNEAYRSNVVELEDYADFNNQTRTIYQATFLTESNNEPLAVSDVTTKPYNILISGNDTYGDVGELSRSDVNMVVTVNPMTSTVLLTSIPRDSYVEVDCGDAYSCAEGERDKITHTGLNGIASTKQTIEKLLDIEINYTFRVNFSSVTDIVDSLGGIDVEIPEGMAVETFYADSTLEGVTEGWNHLDGARALSFARERYAYVDGDNQRVRNQQTVLKAIFNKATSPDIIVNYPHLLNALQKAFDTNLTREEITDFIKYQIQAMPGWKFESYQVSGNSDMLFCPSMGQEASVIVLDYYTVALAHDKIQAVLDGKDADEVTEPESSSEDIQDFSGSLTSDDQSSYENGYTDEYTYYDPYPDYPVYEPEMDTGYTDETDPYDEINDWEANTD